MALSSSVAPVRISRPGPLKRTTGSATNPGSTGSHLGLATGSGHLPIGPPTHSDSLDSTAKGKPVPAETHVEQSPMDRQQVLDLIRDRLADILEIEPGTINEGDSFADDLDADSLALIELVEALEEELAERTVGFRIEDEDLEELKTVRDAVDYVVGKL